MHKLLAINITVLLTATSPLPRSKFSRTLTTVQCNQHTDRIISLHKFENTDEVEGQKKYLRRYKIPFIFSRAFHNNIQTFKRNSVMIYRGADKSLARRGRKQATAAEGFDVRVSYLKS